MKNIFNKCLLLTQSLFYWSLKVSQLLLSMLQKEHQAIDILLAEIDIYELFAFKHCKGRKVKLALCEGKSHFVAFGFYFLNWT